MENDEGCVGTEKAYRRVAWKVAGFLEAFCGEEIPNANSLLGESEQVLRFSASQQI